MRRRILAKTDGERETEREQGRGRKDRPGTKTGSRTGLPPQHARGRLSRRRDSQRQRGNRGLDCHGCEDASSQRQKGTGLEKTEREQGRGHKDGRGTGTWIATGFRRRNPSQRLTGTGIGGWIATGFRRRNPSQRQNSDV